MDAEQVWQVVSELQISHPIIWHPMHEELDMNRLAELLQYVHEDVGDGR